MGWTFLHKGAEKPKEFFKREFYTDNERYKIEVQDYATKGNVAYLAMKCTPKPGTETILGDVYQAAPDGTYVFGMVVLTARRKDYHDFGYKEIEESMGPCESDCPLRILKQLSPIIDTSQSCGEWAADWRARSERNAAKKGEVHATYQ